MVLGKRSGEQVQHVARPRIAYINLARLRNPMIETDYGQFYALEDYLFRSVSPRFSASRELSAFDFFCIVIWKANRSKSKVAKRLLGHGIGYPDLQTAIAALAASISGATNARDRLSVLVEEWGFRLPMASAILTVLYPEEFTVYDVRVCEVLGDFHDAQYKQNFAALWERYTAYVKRVRNEVPHATSLREKDRYLWGKSFAYQLTRDIDTGFRNSTKGAEAD